MQNSTPRVAALVAAPLLVVLATTGVMMTRHPAIVIAASPDGPQVTVLSPQQGAVLPLDTVQVHAEARDPDGIGTAELLVNDKRVAGDLTSTGSEASLDFVWTPDRAQDYTLRVRARDLAGNWGEAVLTVSAGTGEVPLPPPPTTVPFTTVDAGTTTTATTVAPSTTLTPTVPSATTPGSTEPNHPFSPPATVPPSSPPVTSRPTTPPASSNPPPTSPPTTPVVTSPPTTPPATDPPTTPPATDPPTTPPSTDPPTTDPPTTVPVVVVVTPPTDPPTTPPSTDPPTTTSIP